MGYWYCPACHAGLYWREQMVRSSSPPGEGKCPFCNAALRVHRPRLLWILAVIGGIPQFIVTVVDRQLLSALAAQYLSLDLTPQTIVFASLVLQTPWLVLGSRFDLLRRQGKPG